MGFFQKNDDSEYRKEIMKSYEDLVAEKKAEIKELESVQDEAMTEYREMLEEHVKKMELDIAQAKELYPDVFEA